MRLNIFNYQMTLRRIPDVTQIGSYSICEDGQHVLYLDYDELPLTIILTELKAIQNLYDIGNIYIIETSKKKYHAISVDKVNVKEYDEILKWLNVDPNHRKGPKFNNMNSFVLRLNDYNNYTMKIICNLSNRSKREKSKVHAKLLNSRFPELIKITKQFDDSKQLFVCGYETYAK